MFVSLQMSVNMTRSHLIVFVVGAGAVASCCGLCTFNLARALWREHSFPENAVRDCHELVCAIYRYRDENGHWPKDLDVLVPRYIALLPKSLDYSLRFEAVPDGADNEGFDALLAVRGTTTRGKLVYSFGRPGAKPEQAWTVYHWEGGSSEVACPRPVEW